MSVVFELINGVSLGVEFIPREALDDICDMLVIDIFVIRVGIGFNE